MVSFLGDRSRAVGYRSMSECHANAIPRCVSRCELAGGIRREQSSRKAPIAKSHTAGALRASAPIEIRRTEQSHLGLSCNRSSPNNVPRAVASLQPFRCRITVPRYSGQISVCQGCVVQARKSIFCSRGKRLDKRLPVCSLRLENARYIRFFEFLGQFRSRGDCRQMS